MIEAKQPLLDAVIQAAVWAAQDPRFPALELTELDGSTRMVMTHAGIPADSPGAMGWNMALDKLEAHLAT